MLQKKYGAMEKYNDGDNNRDSYRNKDWNDDGNATSGSGSNDPIFDPITTPWSRLSLVEEDWETTTTGMRLQRTMYLRVGLYI